VYICSIIVSIIVIHIHLSGETLLNGLGESSETGKRVVMVCMYHNNMRR
jgi:hypothetical protein